MAAIAASIVIGATVGTAAIVASKKASKATKSAAATQAAAARGLQESSDYAAKLSYDLGKEELDFTKRQYEEALPLRDEIVGLQMEAARQQQTQAQDYYDYMRGTFRPAEQRLAAQAAQYDTAANRERLAQEASQRAALAFQGGQQVLAREAQRRGVNPASAAYGSMANQNAIAMAAQQASGANQARLQAEQLGWARNLDVTGLGRNLPGASSGAYSGAVGAGSSALGSQMAPGAQQIQGFQAGISPIMQGQGQKLTGYGNLYSGANTLYGNMFGEQMGLYGSVLGVGGSLGAGYFGSR